MGPHNRRLFQKNEQLERSLSFENTTLDGLYVENQEPSAQGQITKNFFTRVDSAIIKSLILMHY